MGELAEIADPRLQAWLNERPGRTHRLNGARHELRELGILLASNANLAAALATARRRG